jgi:hypothetical protein
LRKCNKSNRMYRKKSRTTRRRWNCGLRFTIKIIHKNWFINNANVM